jgi:glutathione peroxidase
MNFRSMIGLNGFVLAGVLGCAGVAAGQDAPAVPASAQPQVPEAPKDVLANKVKDIEGKQQDLNQYRGKVVLIINVASKCGYTHQYVGLEKLYSKYKDRGLVILGFPANDFGSQEPGDAAEIKKTCYDKYSVTFPMYEKISVVGKEQHALYKAITSHPKPQGEEPKWNFTKYLINRKGELVSRFESRVKPDDSAFVKQIEDLLGAEGAAPEPAKQEPTKVGG